MHEILWKLSGALVNVHIKHQNWGKIDLSECDIIVGTWWDGSSFLWNHWRAEIWSFSGHTGIWISTGVCLPKLPLVKSTGRFSWHNFGPIIPINHGLNVTVYKYCCWPCAGLFIATAHHLLRSTSSTTMHHFTKWEWPPQTPELSPVETTTGDDVIQSHQHGEESQSKEQPDQVFVWSSWCVIDEGKASL